MHTKCTGAHTGSHTHSSWCNIRKIQNDIKAQRIHTMWVQVNHEREGAGIIFPFSRKVWLFDDIRTNVCINPFLKKTMNSKSTNSRFITGVYKRCVNKISISTNPAASLGLCVVDISVPENLVTSFAMSPIFSHHPNTTDSITFISSVPWSSWTCGLLWGRVDTPCCPREIWLNHQPKFPCQFWYIRSSLSVVCDVQCSVKMGFSYSLLFFTDKMLLGFLQFCEMKQQ